MKGAMQAGAALLLALTSVCSAAASSAKCESHVRPKSAPGYALSSITGKAVRRLTPQFFGFNIEWVEFQSSMWSQDARSVAPEVVEWLRAFPGAVYRYPGGTVANHFDWQRAVDQPARRAPQRAVDWRGELVADFGLDEYLDFVGKVGGKAWYVVNLFGKLGEERPAKEMSEQAGSLARHLSRVAKQGQPGIFRWELGNELDRDRYRWRPEKLAAGSLAAIEAIRKEVPDAAFVAAAQDWDALKKSDGISATDYNSALSKALSGRAGGFASHHYYDGRPWGPPVPNQIRQHCRNTTALQTHGTGAAEIWITEHGRAPTGTPAEKDWKANWPQTANLGAAVSAADFVIALAADPAVKGQFLHALHATNGPWPLFHRYAGGKMVPSAVYWGMRVLRQHMLDNVIESATASANRSEYEGGYDIRGLVMASDDRSAHSLWLINRHSQPVQLKVAIASLANRQARATMDVLDGAEATVSNYGGIARVRPRHSVSQMVFGPSGEALLEIPPHSVSGVTLKAIEASR